MASERHELDIVIDKHGRITVDVKGAKGHACLEYVDVFEKTIGRVRNRKLTSEYYEPGQETRLADADRTRSRVNEDR